MAPPSLPRTSASCVILNELNHVLLVQRSPNATSFAGMYVFPGGNHDPADGSIRMTAIRETFEESGLLLASSTSPTPLPDPVLDDARRAIHAQQLPFTHFLAHHSLVPDTAALLPFTQWITPPTAKKRFHTHFFLTFLPSASSFGFSHGVHHHRLPTPDGGLEVISARFIHIADALADFRAGTIAFMPPQYYILVTLAHCLGLSPNRPALPPQSTQPQRDALRRLSAGQFGQMIINPRALAQPTEDGTTVLTYEGDETRGGAKGRLHRSQITFREGGIPSQIVLHRNFDIFADIDPTWFTPRPKI